MDIGRPEGTHAVCSARHPIEVDLRAYSLARVESLLEKGNDLLGWAVTYGQVLLDKGAYWERILNRWRERVPLPSVDLAMRRAADALNRFRNMLDLGDEDAAYEQALSYVTHPARAELLKRKLYPPSRPELPRELRTIKCNTLASCLDMLIDRKVSTSQELIDLLEPTFPQKTQDTTKIAPFR